MNSLSENWTSFFRNTKWFVFHKRRRSPFFHHIFLSSPTYRQPWVPFDHRIRQLGAWCDVVAIPLAEKERLAKIAYDYLVTNPNYLLDVMNKAYQLRAENETKWGKIQQDDFGNVTSEFLAETLKSYVSDLLSYGAFITLPLFIEGILEETLKVQLEKQFGSEAQRWYSVAVTPTRTGSVVQEELSLLQLASAGNSETVPLEEHIQQFSWMANVSYEEEYYAESYYRSRLIEMGKNAPGAKLSEMLAHQKQQTLDFAELLEIVKDNQELFNLVRTVNEAVFFRSFRTEMYYSSSRYFGGLFRAIGKRLNLANYKDVLCNYSFELYEALLGKSVIAQELLDKRKGGYAFITDFDGGVTTWDGEEAKEVFKDFEFSQSKIDLEQTNLQGSVAFPGIRKGRVCLVKNLDELVKVALNDILVTHATNVNFVPVLAKVAAIVTEEGGILSHAAIISRELHIPCVIGTKIATQVLHDGDLVEVDAERGVVTVLQRADGTKTQKKSE